MSLRRPPFQRATLAWRVAFYLQVRTRLRLISKRPVAAGGFALDPIVARLALDLFREAAGQVRLAT